MLTDSALDDPSHLSVTNANVSAQALYYRSFAARAHPQALAPLVRGPSPNYSAVHHTARSHGLYIPDVCYRGVPLREVRAEKAYHTPIPVENDHCSAKPAALLWGFHLVGRIPLVCRSCAHNELVALVNRMFGPHRDDYDAWDRVWETVQRCIRRGVFRPFHVEPTAFDVWLNRPSVSPAKRLQLVAARNREATAWRPRHFRSSLFVKWEMVVKAIEAGPPRHNPRAIQGRTDAERVTVGPWLFALSGAYKRAFNLRSWICYDSGHTAEDLGTWFDYHRQRLSVRGPVVAFGNDAPFWDGSVDLAALNFDEKLHALFSPPPDVRDALRRSQHTTGWTRGGIFYSQFGTQQSGHDKTTVDNTPKNLFMHVHAAEIAVRQLHGPAADPADYCAIIGRGDDNLCLTSPAIAAALHRLVPTVLEQCGFGSKVVVDEMPAAAEYCSGRWYPTLAGPTVWGPKIGRAAAKLSWRLISGPEPLGYRAGVARGAVHDYNHVPVLRAFAHRLALEYGTASDYSDKTWRARPVSMHEPCAAGYELCAAVYGVSVADLIALEDSIMAVPSLPCSLWSPTLARILEVDTSAGPPCHAALATTYDGAPNFPRLCW